MASKDSRPRPEKPTDKRLPTLLHVTSFCGCMGVETGTIFIAILNVPLCVLLASFGPHDSDLDENAYFISTFVLFCLSIVNAYLIFYGVYRRNVLLIQISLIASPFLYLWILILFTISFVYKMQEEWKLGLSLGLAVYLLVYSWAVTYSFYRHLKEDIRAVEKGRVKPQITEGALVKSEGDETGRKGLERVVVLG